MFTHALLWNCSWHFSFVHYPDRMILHPNSRLKFAWGFVLFFASAWFCFSIPLTFALGMQHASWLRVIDVLAGLIFLFDIALSFRTGYIAEGEIILDPVKIKTHYLKSWFYVDMLGSLLIDIIPWMIFLILPAGERGVFESLYLYIRFLRVGRVIKIPHLFEAMSFTQLKVKLTMIVVFIFVVINLTACGWMLIYPNDGVLPHPYEGAIYDPYTFYNLAVYWTVTTLTTVGYGDYSPVTNGGRIYTSLVMMCGAGMYAFIIGNISTLLLNANSYKVENTKKIQNLSDFMNFYQIPENIQTEVLIFFQHQLSYTVSDSETQVIDQLPKRMQEVLKKHININMLSKVPLFAGADQESLVTLGQKLRKVIFTPHDLIIQKDEVGKEMYFIHHGVVEILTGDGILLAKMHSGDFFGEIALLTESRRTATVRSLTYSDLYILEKDDFMEVLEKDKHLKDSIYKKAAARYPGLEYVNGELVPVKKD